MHLHIIEQRDNHTSKNANSVKMVSVGEWALFRAQWRIYLGYINIISWIDVWNWIGQPVDAADYFKRVKINYDAIID